MRIGELSSRTGISQRMLRYYEQEGLLEPKRTHAGYRTYSTQAESIARHIRNLSEAGIKLKSIRMLLPCLSGEKIQPPRFDCPEARSTLLQELEKLDHKLEELTASRELVAGFLNHLFPETEERDL